MVRRDTKTFREGYTEGKDSQNWKLNSLGILTCSSWILALVLGLIVSYQHEQIKDYKWSLDHNEKTYDTLMNACDNAYKELVVDYKNCKAANEGRPVITDFNVSIYRCGGTNETSSS